jgi:hypothetical protein
VATCRRTVSDPCPISAAAIIKVAPSPSSRTRMIAFECGKELTYGNKKIVRSILLSTIIPGSSTLESHYRVGGSGRLHPPDHHRPGKGPLRTNRGH